MSIAWYDSVIENPPAATVEAVARAEQDLGVRLPPDFLKIAREHQGAMPEPSAFDLPDGTASAIDHLLHFEQTPGHSNIVARRFPVDEVLPRGVVPFAEDGGGNLLCFDFRKDFDNPPVVFWSHDGGGELQPVAANFQDLLGKLHD